MCDKGPDGLMLRERLIRLADEYAAPIEMYDGEEHLRGLEQALKQLKQNGGPSPDYKSFLETVQAMVGASQGMVFIRDRDTGRYDLKAHSAEPSRVGKPGNSYELGEGFTGWVAEHNYSLRLPNKFFTDAELDAIHLGLRPAYKFSDTAIGLQNPPAYMAVPIAVSDEVLGVLRLTGSLRQCFSPDDEQSAMAASSRLAGYLFEIQEGQRNQLLMEFAARIPEMKGLLQLRKKVFEVLRAGLGACDGNIRTLEYIPEGSGESEPVLLRLATSHDDWVVGPLIRRKGEGIAGLLLETDAPEFVDEDIRRPESPCQQMRKDLPPEFFSEVRSLVCIRIETGSRLVGSLYVHKRHPRAFSNLDLAFIRKVARLAGLGLETVDKLESNGLELAVAHSADNFLLGLLRGENTQSLEPKLLRELLGELIEGLGGRLGWVRILNEVENRFDALDSERFRLTAVPAVPAETLLELIGPEGLRVVFVEERDQALLSLLDLWDRQYRGAINKLQWCFLTLSVGGKVLAVYTVLAPRHMAISYKRANKGREFLRVIGDKIVIGRRFEQQQRDVNIGTPLALLGSMIGGLEHRALGPMRKMKSMIEFLKSRSRTPAQIQERDQAMTEEYTKLEKYMAELRTLPGLSRDPFFLEVDVVAVVQSAKEEVVTKMNNVVRVEGQPHTTRPSIRSEYPSGPLRMRGNAKYLQEALQFVIENAWQVAERREGGEVSIRVCRSPSNACQIVIADNGAGMDEQICGRALEMFFSTKPTGVGLGIGLPTAYFIVRSHGGEFQLDSKKGEGTKITITLKLKGDEE
jgi:signal transduction histidine kinase